MPRSTLRRSISAMRLLLPGRFDRSCGGRSRGTEVRIVIGIHQPPARWGNRRRGRAIRFCLGGVDDWAARQHGKKRARHQQRQGDVHDHEASTIATMPKKWTSRAVWKLRRTSAARWENCTGFQIARPDRHLDDPDDDDADIEQPLHHVVEGEVVVGEMKAQCITDGREDLARADRKQLASGTDRSRGHRRDR